MILNKEVRAMGFIGVCEAVVEVSWLVVSGQSVPALAVPLGMHTEVLSGVRYTSILVTRITTNDHGSVE